jgi:hypothetical protein
MRRQYIEDAGRLGIGNFLTADDRVLLNEAADKGG